MCRCKMVAFILLIVSVFNFVLAAPVAVQEVREAWADAMDGGEDVIIALGKRAQHGYPPWLQKLLDEDSDSDTEPSSFLRGSQHQGSSAAPNYASGSHPGIQQGGNLYQQHWDSDSESESELEASRQQGSSPAPNHASGAHPGLQQMPSFSEGSGETKPSLPSTSGGSDLPSAIRPASEPSGKAKKVTWGPTEVIMLPPSPPHGEAEPVQPASAFRPGLDSDSESDSESSSSNKGSESDSESSSSSSSSRNQGSSSAPSYASGTHPDPHQMPSFSESSGETKPSLPSTSGGSGLPWQPPEGEANPVQPASAIRPASESQQGSESSSSKEASRHQGSSSAPSYDSGTHPDLHHQMPSFSESSGETKPPLPSISGGSDLPWQPPEGEAKPVQPASAIRPVSESSGTTEVFMSPPSPPPERPLPLPPGREGYLARIAAQAAQAGQDEQVAQDAQPEAAQAAPQSSSSSKSIFSKLRKLKFRPRFWRHISGIASGVL